MIRHSDLGLHRIALFAANRPALAWPLLLVVILASAFGLSRLTTDASLTKAFHSGTPEYETYEKLTSAFPGSEHNIFILVQGPDLFKPDVLIALREMHFELPLIDHVQSVTSIFSLRKSATTGADPDPIIPEELPDTSAGLEKLEQILLRHPAARQRLLSPKADKNQLTLFALSLDPEKDGAKIRKALIEEATSTANELLAQLDLKLTIGGVPVARQELLGATEGDSKLFSALGFLIGLLIGAAVFRQWQFVIVASICPLVAIASGVGIIGLSGAHYSPFMAGIPPLIMAIAFTDSMHLLFSIRRNVQNNLPTETAIRKACKEVGPACGIASLTTAAALLSLAIAPSPLVTEFGIWAAAAAVVAVCVVFLALPLLSLLAFRNMKSVVQSSNIDAVGGLSQGCRKLAQFVEAHSGKVSTLSLIVLVLLAATYYKLEPQYRLSDQVPIDGSFRQVNTTLDQSFGGSAPIYVLVKWKPNAGIEDKAIFRAVSAGHKTLSNEAPGRNVVSLRSLGHEFPNQPDASEAQILEAMKLFTEDADSSLLRREQGAALISVLLPDLSSTEIVRFASKLDRSLETVRKSHAQFRFYVTGLPVLLAEGSPSLITQLNKSLIAAFIIVIGMLGILFRSWQAGLISILPNVLPVFAAGCAVYLMAGGLEYASVIALTVGFGLAVDDTAHFLNRLKLEQEQIASANDRIVSAVSHVGPILILTSIILVCGLAVTAFGELRTAYLFGTSCMVILIGALIADLVFLPAILFATRKYKHLRLWN